MPEPLTILYLGDVVGNPGRLALQQRLPALREHYAADLVVVNAENAANGTGLTPSLYAKLKATGIDGMTLGDHAYKKIAIRNTLDTAPDLCRPANLPKAAAGKGYLRLTTTLGASGASGGDDGKPGPPVYVLPVLGRIFMNHFPAGDPFAAVDHLLHHIQTNDPAAVVIVEVHAEATSEKIAMGWHCNGRVAAVLGTHTHTPTADARILPPGPEVEPSTPPQPGTAFISDLGMTGPYGSVLGRQADKVLTHMTTAMPAPFDVATADPRVAGVCLTIDPTTRRCTRIQQVIDPADVTQPPFV